MATLSRTPSPMAGSGSDSDSAVATPMTPRTKLRELFATVDGGDSSSSDHEREDDEENQTPTRRAKKSAGSKLSAKRSPKVPGVAAFSRANNAATSPLHATSLIRSRTTSPAVRALNSSSDEDSDVEVRPRGRFAARMQAATSNATALDATEASPEPQADNARERVKRMLQQAAQAEEKKKEVEHLPLAAKSREDTNNDAEDEDEDGSDDSFTAAVWPRRRLGNLRTARPGRPASPREVSTPSRSTNRDESAALSMTPTKHAERGESPDMFMTPSKGGNDSDMDDSATTVAGAENPGRQGRLQALVARKRAEARALEEAEERKRAARQAAMAENSDDDMMGDLDEDDDLLMRDADDINGNISDITDDEGGRRLTQEVGGTRPARKASKKALEEMHRETQRMSRNLQLAHEAKTRKKITKASLFERFNFKPQGVVATVPVTNEATASSRPSSPVSPQHQTDTEIRGDAETPPSSPPVPVIPDAPFDKSKMAVVPAATRLDKGKGRAIDVIEEQPQPQPRRQVRVRMPISTQAKLVTIGSDDDDELEIVQTTKNKLDHLFDNVPLKREQEPRSLFALRRLAQIGSPGKKHQRQRTAKDGNNKTDLTLGELQQTLQDRARRQAKLEREQRLDALRAKGVRIQTEEEREKEMEEVDDIVARARFEAEELMEREREEAKKEKKERVGDGDRAADPLDWDDSEEEEGGGDYQPEEDDEEEQEIELSGSEDEENEEEKDEETIEGALIDDEAESADDSEDGNNEAEIGDEASTHGAEDVLPTPTRARPGKRRAALIISDDEDEDDDTANATPLPLKTEAKTPGPKTVSVSTPSGLNPKSDSPQVPTSVLRSATKPFIPGLPVPVGGPAGLGLTQIFAGTLNDDSQLMGSGASEGFGSPTQFMPTIGNFVDPNYSQKAAGEKPAAILDSQPTQEWLKRMQGGTDPESNTDSNASIAPSQMVQFNFSQSQAHGLDSLLREADMSQMSELLGPSQDNGPQEYTPLKVRFIEHQPLTMDTVVLDRPTQTMDQTQLLTQSHERASVPSPVVTTRPKGRLFRKMDVTRTAEEDEEDEEEARAGAEQASAQKLKATGAFAEMKKAAARKMYDRKKSRAKGMVEEQAEESEDEYAGLGGADGEDSDDDSLASVEDLIDDNQKTSSTDNAKLAAFYADRERESDEKQVEKLFRDVTTGMLRRKRGAGGGGDYDLSDSDDGGEARRRMKRRQFARMQKALFTDERVSKVAENPRNHAFLRTIEDRGSDDEMDFILEQPAAAPAAAPTAASSSSTSVDAAAARMVAIPDSQPATATAASQPTFNHPRRRRPSASSGKKPSNLGEIRESLSSLLEDFNHQGSNLSIVADSEFGSDGEEAGSNENHLFAKSTSASSSDRRGGRNQNVQVVDRISLKRNSSSASSLASAASVGTYNPGASTGAGRGPTSMGPTGFRVPALLRRATTNSLASNGSSSSSSVSRTNSFSMSTMRGAGDKATGSSGSGSGSGPDNGMIKKNASKMSGIHYFARENERRAALAEGEKRRQAKKVRGAEGRSRAVGGLFGAGKFD